MINQPEKRLTDDALLALIIELQQTAYRLNGTNAAYLMTDASKALSELQERREADAAPVYQFRIRNSYNGFTTEWQTLKNREDVDFVLKEQPLNSEFRIIGAVPSTEKVTSHLEALSRYDLGGHCDSFGQDCGAEMEVCEDGDFVRFCDVEALLKSQFSE